MSSSSHNTKNNAIDSVNHAIKSVNHAINSVNPVTNSVNHSRSVILQYNIRRIL